MKETGKGGIQDKIITYLKTLPGVWCVKFTPILGSKGVPDIICCIDGRFVGMEVKVPGKDATKLQRHIGSLMMTAGAIWEVVHSVDEAAAVVKELRDE